MATQPPFSNTATPFPNLIPAMPVDDDRLLGFLRQQAKEFGGNLEFEPQHWALFAVPATDEESNNIAKALLSRVTFNSAVGQSEDDAWTLYFVTSENRAAALAWLENMDRILTGQILLATPGQLAIIKDIVDSDMPHRLANQLAETHANGDLPAGVVSRPQIVRGLLDRLHMREPLFYSAFQILLDHYLIDMEVLYKQIMDEDISIANSMTLGSISRDPFLQSRQATASNIRTHLIKFNIISALDQQKQATAMNPYVAVTETKLDGDSMMIRVEGIDRPIPRKAFMDALRLFRKHMYRGTKIESMHTQTPWMTDTTAAPLRFIKQQLDAKKGIRPIDWLYMLERAVDPTPAP